MQFTESWLRSFVDPQLSSEELSYALTMSGLEVEKLAQVAPPTSKIVVGNVLEVIKHPNADKLKICQVDVGTGKILTIVCGATNVLPGIKVPTAQIGAILPPVATGGAPFELKPLKLRGIESQGMLCSASELKLSDDSSGLLVLPNDALIGDNIRDVLQLDDMIFKIKLTPNKADCLSVFGIAREAAAITGAPLNMPSYPTVPITCDARLLVFIEAPKLCGRFSGRVIRNVNAQARTPAWMVRRLERAGQRSISALVDISNYVMFELGRPSHLFDIDKINGGLHVRWGRSGETLKLLNGSTIKLDETVGVIADDQGYIESLAGIMGGSSTAVMLNTQNIYLEAAFWWPDSIRGRARQYNLFTHAAYRFERGVDYSTTVEHIEYLTYLITTICGGNAGPVDDHISNLPQRKPVLMRVSQVKRIIGMQIDANEIASIFSRLNLLFERSVDSDMFMVTPPAYRFDIEIEEDLIEEIARIYGFEKIPARLPITTSKMQPTNETRRSIHTLRRILAIRDYSETVNFSFVNATREEDFACNKQPIALLNPIASQLSLMRSTLFGSLIDVLRYNLNRQVERVRVFEVSRIFYVDSTVKAAELAVQGVAQPKMIGALAYGSVVNEQWGVSTRYVDFFDVKGDVQALFSPIVPRFIRDSHVALHPGRSARIEIDNRIVGWIGELHPRWLQKYDLSHVPVLFEVEVNSVSEHVLPSVTEISKFPLVHRDIAVIVPKHVEVQSILDEFSRVRMRNNALRFVQDIAVFDEYRPKFIEKQNNVSTVPNEISVHEKSIAFRLTLQDTDGSLRHEEIEPAIAALIKCFAQVFGARLRG
ncbi:phenylalanine--tRNA ligase subunit beta [Candidatus Vallotia cooleyia]|uniref:phenylalanine--tRNA ligase subunit beta n=1 Tax=Candidatus Vallotiella adelgis TaxID=1177211 RepID=UPI001D021D98|nr:phenylalanine--tRNA ligase subunit beta [Candidatus Vallotia cooleyia]UDG81981.1 Phenylalanine--tRNA ligase beta subunit [Candidatus Vallotia cooleyia]